MGNSDDTEDIRVTVRWTRNSHADTSISGDIRIVNEDDTEGAGYNRGHPQFGSGMLDIRFLLPITHTLPKHGLEWQAKVESKTNSGNCFHVGVAGF